MRQLHRTCGILDFCDAGGRGTKLLAVPTVRVYERPSVNLPRNVSQYLGLTLERR